MNKMRALGMEAPARSPDLNPIENLFGFAEERLADLWAAKLPKDAAATLGRFRRVLAEAATSGDLLELARSMPNRMRLVLEKKGGNIKY